MGKKHDSNINRSFGRCTWIGVIYRDLRLAIDARYKVITEIINFERSC